MQRKRIHRERGKGRGGGGGRVGGEKKRGREGGGGKGECPNPETKSKFGGSTLLLCLDFVSKAYLCPDHHPLPLGCPPPPSPTPRCECLSEPAAYCHNSFPPSRCPQHLFICRAIFYQSVLCLAAGCLVCLISGAEGLNASISHYV